MPEIVTTLTGFSVKPGDDWELTKFEADDGKKYQTFDKDVAEKAKGFIGKPARITFEVQTRTSNNKTFTNNAMQDIADPSAPSASGGNGAAAVASPVLERVAAFEAGLHLVEVVAPESISFASVTGAADNILAWAKGETTAADEEDIEPPAADAEAVSD